MASAPASPGLPTRRLDAAAILLSLLCLVHCLAFPLLVALLPLAALPVDVGPLFHWLLLLLAVPIGLVALGRGRRHAGPLPLAFGLVGFGLMAAAVALLHDTPGEVRLTVVGVLLVATAHVANWRAGLHPHRAEAADRDGARR